MTWGGLGSLINNTTTQQTQNFNILCGIRKFIRHQWFSGKISRCQREAPSSILGWRIRFSSLELKLQSLFLSHSIPHEESPIYLVRYQTDRESHSFNHWIVSRLRGLGSKESHSFNHWIVSRLRGLGSNKIACPWIWIVVVWFLYWQIRWVVVELSTWMGVGGWWLVMSHFMECGA
jgi:hypothetical protein